MKWISFFVGLFLIVASITLTIDQNNREFDATRGWELATRNENIPFRTALAGINVDLTQYAPDEVETQLTAIAELGFTWLRQPIYWEQLEPEQGVFKWEAYDHILQTVATHPQFELIAVIIGTPFWASSRAHPFAPPIDPRHFGDFARAFAERYADSVDLYQIWDEPNFRTHWGNTDPDPTHYLAMLQAAYSAIHETDETASVILGALAPTGERGPKNISDSQYLAEIYALDGGDYFDAVAGKPYGFNHDPYERVVNHDALNFSRIIMLHEEMIAHGDGAKPLWASGFGWNHLPTGWIGKPSIWDQVPSIEHQIDYTRRAYQRASHEWPWLAGLILDHWEPNAPPDDPLHGFAIAPYLDKWHKARPLMPQTALSSGLYPVQNPFTEFVGEWQFGPLGADALPVETAQAETLENIVTIKFYGTEFALLTRRYDTITGYYLVSIDGKTANALPTNRQGESQIVLKAVNQREEIDLTLIATGLEAGEHTAIFKHRPRQGDDAWGMVGFAVGIAPDTSSYARWRQLALGMGILGAFILLFTASRISWQKMTFASPQVWRNVTDLSLTFAFSCVFVLGTALSWGDTFTNFVKRDPPAILLTLTTVGIAFFSPIVILSLLALAAFAVIVFNRPVMGLLAVVFWSMFFANTIDSYIRLITVVEAMLYISTVAIIGRELYEQAKQLRQNSQSSLLNHFWQRFQTNLFSLRGLDLAMLAFVGLAVTSVIWTELRSVAVHELRVMVLGPALLYLLLRNAKLSKSDLTLLVDTIILGGTTIAAIGLYNYATGEVIQTADGSRRLIAIYGSPNNVALHLGRCLPFALAYSLITTTEIRRFFGIITSITMLLAFLGTQSLGGIMLGLPAIFVVLLLGWQGKRAWPWIAGLGTLGLLALIPLSRIVPRLRNLDSNTTLFRVNVWRSAIEMLKDYPLTGVGLDNFLYLYRSRYILPEGSADPNLSHPHNFLLDYWVRLGILGLGIGIWLQIVFWQTALSAYRLTRDKDPLLFAIVLGTMGMMADFVSHGLVDIAVFFINLSYLFVAILAIVERTRKLAG